MGPFNELIVFHIRIEIRLDSQSLAFKVIGSWIDGYQWTEADINLAERLGDAELIPTAQFPRLGGIHNDGYQRCRCHL